MLKEKSRLDAIANPRSNSTAMPLSDEALELIFSFLLGKKGGAEGASRLAARPVCRLLQTRRMRGFAHVTLEVCRLGLNWAVGERAYLKRVNDQYQRELRRLALRLPQREDRFAMLEDELVWYV